MRKKKKVQSDDFSTKVGVERFVDWMTADPEKKSNVVNMRDYARSKSDGATGGALKQLDDRIRKLSAQSTASGKTLADVSQKVYSTEQAVKSASRTTDKISDNIEALTEQVNKSLGMISNVSAGLRKLSDNIEKEFEKIDKKLEDIGDGNGEGKTGPANPILENIKKLKNAGKAAVGVAGRVATVVGRASPFAAAAATAYGLYDMRSKTKDVFGESYEKGDLNKIKNKAIKEGLTSITATDAELSDIADKPDIARDILDAEKSGEDWEKKQAERRIAHYGRENLEKIAAGEKLTVKQMREAGPKEAQSVTNIRGQIEAAAGPNVDKLRQLRGETTPSAAAQASPDASPTSKPPVTPTSGAEIKPESTFKPRDYSSGGGPTVDTSILEFIKNKEGFTPVATWDHQQLSNGYGTKAKFPGEVITKEEAAARLSQQVASMKAYVVEYGNKNGYNWNKSQIDALTSFAYNLGPGSISQVTNGGKRSNEEIATMMLEYNKASGKTEPGLVKRRQEEAALFGRTHVDTEAGKAGAGAMPNVTVPAMQPPGPTPAGAPPAGFDYGASKAVPQGLETTPAPAAQSVTVPATPPPGVADASSQPGGAASGQPPASTSTKPENVKVESGRVNLGGVDQDLLGKIYAAAQEYGKPVSINSAFRSDDYQAQLWARWKLGEPGLYMPAKPKQAQQVTINSSSIGALQGKVVDVPGGGTGSSHNSGQAVDLSPGFGADPAWTSILQKYGLTFPFGASDPPHVQKVGASTASGSGGGASAEPGYGQSRAQGVPQSAAPGAGVPSGAGGMPSAPQMPIPGSRAQIPGALGSITGAQGMGPLAGIIGAMPQVNIPQIPGVGGGVLGGLAGMATGALTGMAGNALGGLLGGAMGAGGIGGGAIGGGLFGGGRSMMPPSAPQIPGPMAGPGDAIGSLLGPLLSVVSSLAGGGGGGGIDPGQITNAIGTIASNRNVRAKNEGFPDDYYQNNSVPAAMPSSTLLRELFDLNISPGFNPTGYAFGR